MKRFYLDHNATSPLLPSIADQLGHWASEFGGNPSSAHSRGAKARDAIEGARENFADLVGALDAGQIVFTSGATEANSLAILGRLRAASEGRRKILVGSTEHPAVLKSMEAASRNFGLELRLLPVCNDGVVDLAAAEALIDADTALVALMFVNNEVGTIQPVERVRELCERAGAWFHVDAVQAFGKIPVDIANLGADSVSFSAHKLGGMKGTGALYLRDRKAITPLFYGGAQEFGVRPGTEDPVGILTFIEAAKIRTGQLVAANSSGRAFRDSFEQRLSTHFDDRVKIIGATGPRVPLTTSVRFAGVDSSVLVDILDTRGVECSNGSACSSGAVSPSHVLLAMGLSQQEAGEVLRFSFAVESVEYDLGTLVGLIDESLREATLENASPALS